MANLTLNQKNSTEFINLVDYALSVEIKNKNPNHTANKISHSPTSEYVRKAHSHLFLNVISERGLRAALFEPAKPKSMSMKVFKSFCTSFERITAKEFATEQKKTGAQISLYHQWKNEIQNQFNSQKASKEKPLKPTSRSNKATDDDFTNSFQDSTWYFYERHLNTVGRRVMKFGRANNGNSFSVKIYRSKLGKSDLEGQARFLINDQAIVIALSDRKDKDYTHFMIRIDRSPAEIDLCIGHKTFQNMNLYNIVTKAIILTRCKDDVSLSGELLHLDSNEIPSPVREFFQNSRQLNRLSSPHATPVYSLETLREWIDQNRPPVKYRYVPIIGNYVVFYRVHPWDEDVKEDQLAISFLANGSLHVRYTHEISDKNSRTWEGLTYPPNFESKTLTGYLKGPLSEDATEVVDDNDKPIILMINLPPKEIQVNTLTGIATAPRDGDAGIVARHLVLVRSHAGKLPADFDKNVLQDYFTKFNDRLWVRPPINSKTISYISEFAHLKKIISDIKDEDLRKGI